MVWTQELRGKAFYPLLVLCAQAGVRPGHVTFASLVCGLAFCPLWLLSDAWGNGDAWGKPAALALLALHVLLDGFDGPLARHLGTASRAGSFTDTVADQIAVTAVTLALLVDPQAELGIWAGGLYIFLYAMVVAFAMVRNALETPYSWLVRPRFWVYAWIPVQHYLWPGSLEGVIWVFNALLAVKMFTGFVSIRRML